MKTLLGSELSPSVQTECLRRFVHRFTGEHRPQWTTRSDTRSDCKVCPVQFADDWDWLAHTRFHVTKTGKLDGGFDFCESSPTWPFNPELRKPSAP